MNLDDHDGLVPALIAHRVVEAHGEADLGGEEALETLSEGDELRLQALMSLYSQGESVTGSRGRATRRWPWWVGIGLAAVALLTLMLREAVQAPLPLGTHYEVDLHRELAMVRSVEARAPIRVYREDRSIEIWLRPVEATEPPLEVAAYARRGGETRRLAIEPTVKDNGVVHIVTTVRNAGLTVGDWELLLLVGRPGALPEGLDELAVDADVDASSYDARVVQVRIVPAKEPPVLP